MTVTRHDNYSHAHELGIWYCNGCHASEAIPSMVKHDPGCPNAPLCTNCGEPEWKHGKEKNCPIGARREVTNGRE